MAGWGTRALSALDRAGLAYRIHEYEHRDGGSYGAEAAAAIGADPRRVFKTLVTTVDGRPVVAVVPVAGNLDLKALAAAAGGKRAALADPALAERATGYVRGGISPFGQRRRLPTIVDSTATGFATVYVSAGRRGLQVELAPADLIALTAAQVAPLADG